MNITKKEASFIKFYIKAMVKFVRAENEKESDHALDEALYFRKKLDGFLDYQIICLIRDLAYAKANQPSSQLTYANIFKILEIIYGIKVQDDDNKGSI